MIRIEALNRILDLDREYGPDQGRGGDHARRPRPGAVGRTAWRWRTSATSTSRRWPGRSRPPRMDRGGLPKPLGAGRGARVGAGRRERARAVRAIRPDRVSGRAGGRRGARGIYSVTLRAVPAFAYARGSTRRSRSSGPSRASTTRREQRALRVLRLPPYRHRAVSIERNRTQGPPGRGAGASAFLNEILIENYGMDSAVARRAEACRPRSRACRVRRPTSLEH